MASQKITLTVEVTLNRTTASYKVKGTGQMNGALMAEINEQIPQQPLPSGVTPQEIWNSVSTAANALVQAL